MNIRYPIYEGVYRILTFQGHAGLSVETHQHRCQRKLEKQDTCRGLYYAGRTQQK